MIDRRYSKRQLRYQWKYVAIFLGVIVALMMLVDVQATQMQKMPINEVAYFRFNVPPAPETFVFRTDDPVVIQEARDVLAGKPSRMVIGTIVKEPRDYNLPWSYHLEPETVRFTDGAVEVCDAGIQFIEDHLTEVCDATLPDCEWCPWNSRIIAEVTPDATPTPTHTPTLTPTVVIPPTITPTPPSEPEYTQYLPLVIRGN
ncbi:MAG: hypothetical protein AAGF95_28765 [Chloroflexota bacterium]